MAVNSKMPNSKPKVTLPGSIRDFVERQATLPLASLLEDTDTPVYPYCEYWLRAVTAMLLSGRIAAKDDGFPNMTDVNRICKEANFDQYLFEATGKFLVMAKIIRPSKLSSRYEPAKFCDAFWNHQLQPLQESARQAFLELVQHFTPSRAWRPTLAVSSMLDVLVALFATAFADLAIPWDQAGNVFLEFSKLPSPDLIDLGKQLGFKKREYDAGGWDRWLDEPGQQALLSALSISSWVYSTDHQKQTWIYLSDTARIIFGARDPAGITGAGRRLQSAPQPMCAGRCGPAAGETRAAIPPLQNQAHRSSIRIAVGQEAVDGDNTARALGPEPARSVGRIGATARDG